MANWLRSPSQRMATVGVGANGAGTAVTSSGTANTKGSYAELSSSIPYDCNGITLVLYCATVNDDFLIDLAIGAASSEVVIAANMSFASLTTNNSTMAHIYLPIYLPEGERLSARCQAVGTSKVVQVAAILHYGGGFARDTFGACQTFGAFTGTTRGTQIDPGAVANTKGSWTQITGFTLTDIEQITLLITGNSNTAQSVQTAKIDIGVGAAASEVVVIGDLQMVAHTTTDLLNHRCQGPFPCHIPAGSRIAIRSQSSTTNSVDRLWDAILLGFR